MQEKALSKRCCLLRFARRHLLPHDHPQMIIATVATAFSMTVAISNFGTMAQPSPAGQHLQEVTNFGSNPGNLQMFRYVPSGLSGARPLVVVLHGCSQQASDYFNMSGWPKYADLWHFYLLMPQQKPKNNRGRCFNWFKPGDSQRTDTGDLQGEAQSIIQMIDKMKAGHNIDNTRIYITGVSAGGAMTSVMMAVQPNVFKGGAIIAGIPYGCTDEPIPVVVPGSAMGNGLICMFLGRNLTPTEWANRVQHVSSDYHGSWPVVSIWQGTADHTVVPSNAIELVDQWTKIHGIDQTADIQDLIDGFPHRVYTNASGQWLVEYYEITEMGHGTPLNTGAASNQDMERCGTAGPFMLDVGICSSYYIGRFWGLDQVGEPISR